MIFVRCQRYYGKFEKFIRWECLRLTGDRPHYMNHAPARRAAPEAARGIPAQWARIPRENHRAYQGKPAPRRLAESRFTTI